MKTYSSVAACVFVALISMTNFPRTQSDPAIQISANDLGGVVTEVAERVTQFGVGQKRWGG